MSSFEDDLLLDAEDDARAVEFIKNYLPQELKERFSDEELFYFLDVIVDYYATSGVLEVEPDADGFVDIDQEKVVEYILKQAAKDKMGTYNPEELLWVVQGEMEYAESVED